MTTADICAMPIPSICAEGPALEMAGFDGGMPH